MRSWAGGSPVDGEGIVGRKPYWHWSTDTSTASGLGADRGAAAALLEREESQQRSIRVGRPSRRPAAERRAPGPAKALWAPGGHVLCGRGRARADHASASRPGIAANSNRSGLRRCAGSRHRHLVCAVGQLAAGGQPRDRAARVRPHRCGERVRRRGPAHLQRLFCGRFRVDRHGPSTAHLGCHGPLAAAAYILPLFFLPESIGAGLASAAVTIPVCVLVGEGIAWGVGRLEQIELALARERARTERLRELDELKDKFLSTVSHELRTPITICRGHLEVLDDGAGEHEVRAVREMLIDELGLMGRLVEDLTTLAWGDDRALLRFESLPLDGFMSSITAKAEAILGERVRVRPAIQGATLRADPQRLTQALVNLLQNVADHAKGDGPVRFAVLGES